MPTLQRSLYDSYIRAIRWASDRIGKSGVIGYVSNASFVDGHSMDGLRKCLADEFSSLYIFHLRGNARTSGEIRRKEKDNVFGMGTRTPIAISILVKNPEANEFGKISFCDVGDYLTRDEKLKKIVSYGSINGISNADNWEYITPDLHGDWVGQRDDGFDDFIALGEKLLTGRATVFKNYSLGVSTARDAWVYSFSKNVVTENMRRMTEFYNTQVKSFIAHQLNLSSVDLSENLKRAEAFIDRSSSKISWSSGLIANVGRRKLAVFDESKICVGMYRPFTKQYLYLDAHMIERPGQNQELFGFSKNNLAIFLNGTGSGKGFSALMTNTPANRHFLDSGLCFPFYWFEHVGDLEKKEQPSDQEEMFGFNAQARSLVEGVPKVAKYIAVDGMRDDGLEHFQNIYLNKNISKEDLFYYVYGILHSEDYKKRYADNLSKELPRIPAIKKFEDFQAFSQAGRQLSELHLNYETVEPYPVNIDVGAMLFSAFTDRDYYVTQMKFASKVNKSTVVYNHLITIKGIPIEAYEYVVNGKPALEWVMERQSVTTHKESGIVNDANDWAVETMGNARYPLELFQRVITVSLETMKIVKALPVLDIRD